MKKIIVCVFLFLLMLVSFILISFVNNYFSNRIKMYIENKGVIYTQNYIQNAINNNVIKNLDINSMYLITKNQDDKISSVLINTAQVNNILLTVNEEIEKSITNLENEKLTLPISIIFSETLFSNIGPDITLRIMPLGRYKCDIISQVNDYGINNSLFEIFVKVDFVIETIVPLQKNESHVSCKIPIVMQIIQGEVPRYYYNTDKLIPDVYDNYQNN